MWIAKIEINGEKAVIGSKVKQHNVSVSLYPIQFYKKKNAIFVYFTGFAYGQNKNKFINSLKKEKRIINLENLEDFFIGIIKESIKFEKVYSHKIIYPEPIIINKKGVEFWTICSFEKKVLTNFIKILEKTYEVKIIKMQNTKLKNLSIIGIQPELTKRQKEALELSIREGYYEYPRKIKLKELAKIMKIYYSAFQRHLRVAENKIISSSYRMIK